MRINELWRRFRVFLRRDEWTQELDEEMRLHVELRAKANLERGMAPVDAELAAKRRFGNQLVVRETTRDVWTTQWVESMWKDVLYSTRRLVRDRAATLAIVLTLAIGIGANSAMFTLIDRVLFKPAPVSEPDSLVWLLVTDAQSGWVRKFSSPGYRHLARPDDAFSGVAAFTSAQLSLGGETPERIRGMVVSGNYFDVLGVRALAGRTFRPEDDGAPGANPVAVLSHALWTNRFGADAAIVGKPVTINGRRFEVVGVAAQGFGGLDLEPVAIWLPLAMTPVAMPDQKGLLESADGQWLYAVGRLQPGVSTKRASASLQAKASQMTGVTAENLGEASVKRVTGGLDPENFSMAPVFGLLSIVPLLVLVVACANVANLLLSRGLARRKELALRKALGAERSRLVRQLLVESVLLALIACGVGLLFAYGLTTAGARLAEVPAQIAESLQPDVRVMAASLVLAILAGIIFGVAPALASTDAALVPALKDAGLSMGSGDRRRRLRSAFLVTQVTVSFVLVVVAGLFLQSVSKAMSVDPGFDPQNVVVLAFDPDLQGYDAAGRQRLVGDVIRSVEALPGVESAALTTSPPLAGLMYGTVVSPEGAEGDASMVNTNFAGISPAYFATMRIPVLAGRDFTTRDTSVSTKVAIINDTLASRMWPGGSPLGQRLKMFGADEEWREVVGVVKGGKYDQFSEDPRSFIFLPEAQLPMGRVSLLARTAIDAGPMVETVRQAVRTLDPNMPLFDIGTLEQTMRNAGDKDRGTSVMLAAFGGIGLLLAAFGLYAVTSQAVALRVREIGIRIALGARASAVAGMFVRESLSLCAIGLAIGTVLSLAVSGVIGAFLSGLAASDVLTYFGATALFVGVAALATLIPARRAASVDPLRSLRNE